MKLPRNELNGWIVASVPAPQMPDGSYQGWTPCMDWCRKTFGTASTPNLYIGNNWRFNSKGIFEFKHEQDLTAFLLKWA